MSQQGHICCSYSCSAYGKQHSAVPRVWRQQPAGCQRSNSALQRTKGHDGDGPSLAPCRRTEPARPWNGAGHGGKRKASPEADASGLPLKHCPVERHRRSTAHKRVRGAESNGETRMNAVQEVYSERAHLRTESKAHVQVAGLPSSAGPSEGRRPAPAVNLHSLSKTLPERKRKDLEGAKQATEQLPAYKRVRSDRSREKALRMRQNGDSMPAPAAQPGPAAARSSEQRARRKRRTGQKKRRVEMMKAALRAAAARAESSTVNSLVEMLQKLQPKD